MTNLDEFSRSVINDVELAELVYINPEREISDIPITNPEKYNAEQVKWVSAFFKAHPWIERMVIVFEE